MPRSSPRCCFGDHVHHQPLLFNTLQVRSALGAAQRRKLSFKNVSNVVVQLLHSIKYSMEVPFSNMALQPDMKATSTRKVSVCFVPLGLITFEHSFLSVERYW